MILGSTGIYNFLTSCKDTGRTLANNVKEYAVEFIEGMKGYGFKMWSHKSEFIPEIGLSVNRWKLEIDDLSVRNSLTVYSDLVPKLRSLKGTYGISIAEATIDTIVTELTTINNELGLPEIYEVFKITFKEGCPFKNNDIIWCQNFSDENVKKYKAVIYRADDVEALIFKNLFYDDNNGDIKEGWSLPKEGDFLIHFGNISEDILYLDRHSSMLLQQSNNGKSSLDVYSNLYNPDEESFLTASIGNNILVEGVDSFSGLYSNNGYITSIKQDGTVMYALKPDGSGELCNRSILWDNEGNLSIQGIEKKIIDSTESVIAINPNVLYRWGEIGSLTITLNPPVNETVVNEYMIQFKSGDDATNLSLPSTIKWIKEPEIEANTTYQLSIINNIGVIGGVADE